MASTKTPDKRAELMAALASAVSPKTLQRVLRGDANVRPLSVRRVRRELEAPGLGDLLPETQR